MLGKQLFRRLMKATFYGHFVAGEDQEAIKPVIKNLEKFGVGAILDYSVEEDLSENETKSQMSSNGNSSLDPADEYARYKPHVEFADRRKGVYSARTYFYEGEEECDKRVKTFLKCIDAAGLYFIINEIKYIKCICYSSILIFLFLYLLSYISIEKSNGKSKLNQG